MDDNNQYQILKLALEEILAILDINEKQVSTNNYFYSLEDITISAHGSLEIKGNFKALTGFTLSMRGLSASRELASHPTYTKWRNLQDLLFSTKQYRYSTYHFVDFDESIKILPNQDKQEVAQKILKDYFIQYEKEMLESNLNVTIINKKIGKIKV